MYALPWSERALRRSVALSSPRAVRSLAAAGGPWSRISSANWLHLHTSKVCRVRWAEKAEARALLRIEQSHLAEGHGAIGHFSNTSSSAPARPLVSPYTEDASIQGRINLFVGYVRRKIS